MSENATPSQLARIHLYADFALARRTKLKERFVVASISGGKDSSAMSLWLHEHDVEHARVFCDTGWEHQRTYDYLRGPLTKKLGPIEELRAVVQLSAEERVAMRQEIDGYPLVIAAFEQEAPMVLLALKKGMFPTAKARWCTEQLKEEPIKLYLERRIDAEDDVVSAAGIRADESVTRATYAEWHELRWGRRKEGKLLSYDCDMWRPLLKWSIDDVVWIHKRHNLEPNPMYLVPGVERVGCGPCIRARKAEIRATADRFPERIDLIRELEACVQRIAAKRLAGQQIKNPHYKPPGWFQGPVRSDADRGGCWPIDDVVAWSRTKRGGKELELFAPTESAGCLRWGLCEAPTPSSNKPESAE